MGHYTGDNPPVLTHYDDRLAPGGMAPGKAAEGRRVAEQYDAIVVGAGFGGAASAALLARHGLKTLLLDKNAQPGGKAVTISKEGFRHELWPIV